ncbi:PAS domain-containing protein [Erythrobacter mangrovi]|uniref:PAS domain-containing protein n=1 Tax=Erythrobacter mangrovi TaxID=2739433 RepID=A0A7D3XAT9_9SPHN|nr:hypothetical protein HQR01_05340 [Erythrobacter mangrovi]
MDRLGGYFGTHEADEPLDDFVGEADALPEPPPSPVGQDERRMQVRAYNHWASLLGDRIYPAIDDLEPHTLDDFGPYSVLLDFSNGIEDPTVRFVGAELAAECGEDAVLNKLSDVPSRSVLSRITDHYMQILANQAPIGFEAEFVNDRGLAVLYRGILLPYSSDNHTIDFIYGVINWKEMADQGTADELLLEIGQSLGEYDDGEDADGTGEAIETAESLTAQGETAMDEEGDDVFELGNTHIFEHESDPDLPQPAFGQESFAATPVSKAHRGFDALGNPIGGHGHSDEDGFDEEDGYGDFDSGIKTAADYGLPDWDEDEEEDDVDDLVDPLADDESSSSLMSLVSRGNRNKKSVDLTGNETPPPVPQAYSPDPTVPAFVPEPPTITFSMPEPFQAYRPEDEAEEEYAEEIATEPVSVDFGDAMLEDEEDDEDFAPEFEAESLTGVELATQDFADPDEDEFEEQASQIEPAIADADTPLEIEQETPEGLYDCLAAARELAQAAQNTEDRSRKALYQAVSLAYDFSLETESDPDGFAELLEDNGLTVQDRAPMTPVVKLVFGADYDKTRLTEYAAVLMHAHRIGVQRGTLARYLDEAEGGLKAVVNAERRARKEEQGKPVDDTDGVRKALAKQLRRLDSLELADLESEGPEFALVMVRRTLDGKIVILGEVPEDIPLVERAARKLLG